MLGEIEREIRENYAKNITLKSLSEKYYVNSAYLGQLFRKKNGQSFKDYLNNYRMERAADLLLHTDKKIVEIAEEVGYHDLDYFVNRFILVKGWRSSGVRHKGNTASSKAGQSMEIRTYTLPCFYLYFLQLSESARKVK